MDKQVLKILKKKHSVVGLMFSEMFEKYGKEIRGILIILFLLGIIVIQTIFKNPLSISMIIARALDDTNTITWAKLDAFSKFIMALFDTWLYIFILLELWVLLELTKKSFVNMMCYIRAMRRIACLPVTADECEKLGITCIDDYMNFVLKTCQKVKTCDSNSLEASDYVAIPKSVQKEIFDCIMNMYREKNIKKYLKSEDKQNLWKIVLPHFLYFLE